MSLCMAGPGQICLTYVSDQVLGKGLGALLTPVLVIPSSGVRCYRNTYPSLIRSLYLLVNVDYEDERRRNIFSSFSQSITERNLENKPVMRWTPISGCRFTIRDSSSQLSSTGGNNGYSYAFGGIVTCLTPFTTIISLSISASECQVDLCPCSS